VASSVETIIRKTVGLGVSALADFNRKRLPEPKTPHPFLTGIHRPMTEEKTIETLAVTGTIPAGLDGRYLRIGPNPIAADPASYHWFTGDGMVHGVALKDGKALWYRNRWIKSRSVAAALGVPPAPGPRHGGFDTVNTNVLGIAGRTFALVEAGSYPVELSDALDEQTYNPFDDTLAGSFTAHPHRDPLTGEHHAIAYEATNADEIRHVVLSPEGHVVREIPIAVKHGPSIHDCAITARYVVILDLPVTFSMKAMIAGHRFPYGWNPQHQARVGLLPRDGGNDDVIWCDVDPAYVFHVANAFDAPDGTVVMDVVAYATMFAESRQGPDASGQFERWTIDPVTKRVSRRVIDADKQEFPRPDERRFGLPYRYAYTMALPADDFAIGDTRLYKHDLAAGTRETHDFGTGRHPGEFVFVPAHDAAGEDEGWLIGLVVDLPHETTDLVILNARDFAGEPQASIRIPHRVPPGFHGNWVGDQASPPFKMAD
jgi:carotenoid cleavage dioxygenase-like enzyme